MKQLEHYILKKHTRYISEEAKEELFRITPKCDKDSTNPERLFWVLERLKEYPKCKACDKTLSSFHWEPFLKVELRSEKNKDKKSGYRPFCGKKCAYNFEGLKSEKYRLTSIEKYGSEHPMQNSSVLDKIKNTNIEKYGEDWPMRWGSEKFKETLLKNHGVDNVRALPGVNLKTIDSIATKTTALLPIKIKELEKIFEVRCLSDIESLGRIYRWYDLEFEWEHICGRKYLSNINERGIKSCPKCSSGTSKKEQELFEIIECTGLQVLNRVKNIIAPLEIDIWAPTKKIGIEFDGTCWHSAKFVSKKKSMEKISKVEQTGSQLITVQEHLWVYDKEKVISRIKAILGFFDEKYFARKLTVTKIDNIESKKFLDLNHLQNSTKSKISFGLYNKDDLLAVMSFGKPRFNKNVDWELIRFATKQGVNVVGGASRLLSAFRSEYSGSIISYADRCWSQGKLYKTLNFSFIRNNEPSYIWVSGKFGIFSRFRTQKKKLSALFKNLNIPFEENFSEEKNMTMNKFLKVFDRGNSVWILE